MSPNAPQNDAMLSPTTPQESEAAGSSLTASEDEVSLLLVPEELLKEEQRLREERHQEEEAGTSTAVEGQAASGTATLEAPRFNKLQKLLSTTGMFTTFLSEQIQQFQDAIAVDTPPVPTPEPATVEEPTPKTGSGSKRKGSKKGGKAKKAKVETPPQQQPASRTKELVPLFNGELRDYQLKGVRWLISLYQNGLNGILADQMGLGKTVQIIAFLSYLRNKDINGPYLVVGPLSTLPNWVSEFQRWCPSFPVVLYHGSKQERREIREKRLPIGKYDEKFPVVVTSYEILMADVKQLAAHKYKYIVVDEGHRLKNFNCKLIKDLKTIPADNKLLLTGTPLQNNLSELWSLLNFLLPDVFSSLHDFEDWFDFTGQSAGEQEEQRQMVVMKLHDILKPFLLRRIKADVEISLPAKKEIIMYAQMTDLQKQLNKSILENTLGSELSKIGELDGRPLPPAARLHNMLMQLRKNANHPDLITSTVSTDIEYPPPEVLVEQSGKMKLLHRLLPKLRAEGHKVLIFSQMTRMLDLLDSYLVQLGHRTCRIDGSISWQERQANIRDFNEDPDAWVFLVSTRAGGLGINLTAADTCIIFDSDWNPQQDLQAMDRCHRIGQTKPVLVLRFATANSVDGKMLRRAAGKLALESVVMKKGVFKEIIEDKDGAGTSQRASSSHPLSIVDLVQQLAGGSEDVAEPQRGEVSKKDLDLLLDRTHMAKGLPCPYPNSGLGYEVVQAGEEGMLLKGIE